MSAYTNMIEFWDDFSKLDLSLRQAFQNQDLQTIEQINEELDDKVMKICGSHFFCEFTYDNFEMTFDTGPNKTTQYLALYCSQLAPEAIRKNWIIHSVLPPMSQKAVQVDLRIKEEDFYLNDFTVFYSVNEKNQTLDCLLYCPGYSMIDNTERKKEMSMYLIELAIGQTMYEAYLSSVDFIDVPDENLRFCNLIDFYECLEEIVEKKDWNAYQHPTQIYSIYQPYKEIADDSLRKDMKYIFTTHPLLIEETIEGKKEVLSDLSIKDGHFAYMYFMNLYNDQQDALLRQELSKRLDQEMRSIQAGMVIGGAIGKSYSYIDWIVFDRSRFQKAFENLKKQVDVELFCQYFK